MIVFPMNDCCWNYMLVYVENFDVAEYTPKMGNALNYGSILDIKDQLTINLYVRIQLKTMKFLRLTWGYHRVPFELDVSCQDGVCLNCMCICCNWLGVLKF